MAMGRKREWWWHTAALEAVLMNLYRSPGRSPIRPEDLHPLLPRKPLVKISGKGLSILKDIFCPDQVKREAEAAKKSASSACPP